MEFDFYNPTRLYFGPGSLARLGEAAATLGKKALIVTGGGSVKRSGTFDRAIANLKASGVDFAECTGVEPNPQISSVARGAEIVRREGCDIIVALGGGSTMDASKAIAAAALYDGDPWNLIAHGQADWHKPTKALPVVTVPTLAATGSEMNAGAVISNAQTRIKSFVQAECLFPRFAIVDPELTLTVPKDQTAYGVCDIITHVMEGYFNGVDGTPIQDRFAEGVIINAMEWGRKAVEDGSNLDARTQVQWASIVALNGWVNAGTRYTPPMHMIEHALSAHHNITHGAGLAIVGPAWMRFAARHRPDRFAQFAERIFGLSATGKTSEALAAEGIDAYVAFLNEIGCPSTLSQVGIGDELFDQYARDAALVLRDDQGRLFGRPPMNAGDIVEILRSAL